MAKLTILAAALLVLLALGSVSASRTTITTTMVEEESPENPSQQRCREQIQRQQNLRQCQMYLSQGRRSNVAMVTEQNQQQQQQLRQCCQQLQNIDEQCRCDAVRTAVRQHQQQRGEWQGEEVQDVRQRAEELPSRCNLSPRRCQIRAVWF